MQLPRWVEKVGYEFLTAHDAIYRKTNGWVGHRLLVVPSLLLHTVGAKTNKQRTNTLTYVRDGNDYLVVASNGGSGRAPGWYHNLKAHPDVQVNIGRKRFPATARPVFADDPDFPRLWQKVNKMNRGGYAAYQKRTSRPIPVVVLTPTAVPWPATPAS